MRENDGRAAKPTIQSVDIALRVIETLQTRDRFGVTELADELGHSKSTIHDHLRTLEARRLVVRDGDGYRLTLRFLDIATRIRDRVGNYDVIESEADALADEIGEVVQFGIEEHGRVSYLYKTTGEQAVETRSRPGIQQPMHSTALGKAILAHLSPERTEEIVEGIDFARQTTNTISGPDGLHDELEEIAERGYAVDDEENIQGLRCVAAPVVDDATAFGAISVSGPSSRFSEDRIHGELADSVRRAANVIELNTKFS